MIESYHERAEAIKALSYKYELSQSQVRRRIKANKEDRLSIKATLSPRN